MKRLILALIIINMLPTLLKADEGMWLPMLIERLNIKDMQANGFKLGAKDIYDVNNACMKDAVMLFGRGCTAEAISEKGLIITNHHCGFGQIQSHSSLENDYITNGFWAKNRQEELSNPGLSVSILRYMKDVTPLILEGIELDMTEKERNTKIKTNIDTLQNKLSENDFTKASVSPFYYGNQYILFVSDVYKDVRLVGAPPAAIGKFGGDTDNWMWPRHGGDFSLFRVYANKDNEPSEYSDDNVPYHPKYNFPISTGGIEAGDFTMVFGFPGSTLQYATSYHLKVLRDNIYPKLINIRGTKLDVITAAMDSDPELRIKYAAKAASISNSWKRWIGELKGFDRFEVIAQKEDEEQAFLGWLKTSGKTEYSTIFDDYEKLYQSYANASLAYSLSSEILFRNGIELLSMSEKTLRNKLQSTDDVVKFRGDLHKTYKDYDSKVDEKLAVQLLNQYLTLMPSDYQSHEIDRLMSKANNDTEKAVQRLFLKSVFSDSAKCYKLLEKPKTKLAQQLGKDAASKISHELSSIYYSSISPDFKRIKASIDSLNRIYIGLLSQYDSTITAYPDANLTLRLSYGEVAGYQPRDGVLYEFSTTLNGIMQKDNPDIYDYRVPSKLKTLYQDKDYGEYARKDGKMPICFLATNHTTGGNSGSPVLNANGELIGLNFDRAWEGVMSDLYYDPTICRNISVDIRYVLFIIDKFAGAGYLLDEMNLVD